MTITTRTSSWLAAITIATVVFAHLSAHLAATATANGPQDVKVTVKYTGKGNIDNEHRLWIWLFDTPNIAPGAIPVAEMSLDKNGGVATFEGVAAAKVWIAVAYDERGGFAGMAPPPSGSPIALYMDAGMPAAVAPGEKGEATVTFDDSQRMP